MYNIKQQNTEETQNAPINAILIERSRRNVIVWISPDER